VATALGFVVYDIYHTPYLRWTSYLLPAGIFLMNFYMLYGDWLPFRRGPQVCTLSGITGTQIGQPIQEYGGYETRRVAFPRNLIHPEVRKRSEGIMSSFFDMVSGTVVIELQGKSWQWLDVQQDDLENQNGAIFYLGRIDGGDLRNPELIAGHRQLERQSIIISYVFTAMSKLEEQVANIANVKNLDAEQMAQHLQGIADKVKNVKILTRQGSSSSDIATIGAEMG